MTAISCLNFPKFEISALFPQLSIWITMTGIFLTKITKIPADQVVKEYPSGDETKLAGVSYNMRHESPYKPVSYRILHS